MIGQPFDVIVFNVVLQDAPVYSPCLGSVIIRHDKEDIGSALVLRIAAYRDERKE